MNPSTDRIQVAREADLSAGSPVKFTFLKSGRRAEGFVFRFKGRLLAYENRCMHLPLTLDYGDNRFFTEAGTQLICKTHNALYEPETGLCVGGPCVGAGLNVLEVESDGSVVWLVM